MFAKSVICLLILAGALGASARAECTAPVASPIPDGATATEAEMLAAMKAFKQYDAQANLYMKCLEEETEKAIAKRLSDRTSLKDRQVQAHNAVIDELQAAAGRFNKQVRIFKERPKG